MSSIWHDLRYGVRMLGKRPAFTAIAVATLALGIGANTAILSVGRNVLYRHVPYKDPERLVVVWSKQVKQGWSEMQSSVPDFLDFQHRATAFASLTAYTWTDYETFNLTTSTGAQRLRGIAVLPDIFDVVQMHPFLGREFTDEEFRGNHHVALLGYELWRNVFGADRNLVGQTVRINREPYTVVGILPKDFELPVLDNGLQILVPFRLDSADAADRKSRPLVIAGCLKAANTLQQARAELAAVGAQLAHDYREDAEFMPNIETLRQAGGLQDARSQLPIFFTTVLLMLLIAGANVTGILLSRFVSRQTELVVRSALGATRGRLIRLLLVESMLLAGFAGVVALIVAEWVGDLLLWYRPFYMPVAPDHVLDPAAIAIALSFAAMIGIVVGVFPALTVARTNLHEVMNRASGRIGSGWNDRLRNALIVAEVAISVALLAGASLMVRTVLRIAAVDVGFDPRGIALGRTALDAQRYPSTDNQIAFYNTLVERLRAQPAVRAATAASHFCNFDPSGWCMGAPVRIPGEPGSESKRGGTQEAVMPGYFAAMGTPILRGRAFAPHETAPVIIVDQNFVSTFFPHKDPIGREVELMPSSMRSDDEVRPGRRTIIGVVPAVQRIAYWVKPIPQAYIPFEQNPVRSMYAVVRTTDGSGAQVIRKVVSELDPEVPVFWSATMQEWIDKFYASQRFELLTLCAFAIVALLISASGVYAVISYRITQRTRELGVRLALGASRHQLQWVVLRQAGSLILAGVLAGLAGAGAIGQLLTKFLFGVRPRDPLALGGGLALVLAVSLTAVWLPARCAAQMDPMAALRHE